MDVPEDHGGQIIDLGSDSSAMRFSIPFVSLIASGISVDNLFYGDPWPSLDLDLDPNWSLDSITDMPFNEPSIFDAAEPFDQDIPLQNDENWMTLPESNPTSSEFISDVPADCSFSPDARHKSRSTECKVQDPAIYAPPIVDGLGTAIQQKAYEDLVCPSRTPGTAVLPVCSSRLPQNSFFEAHLTIDGILYYTLLDSFVCAYDHSPGRCDLKIFAKWFGMTRSTVLHLESLFAARIGSFRRSSRTMALHSRL